MEARWKSEVKPGPSQRRRLGWTGAARGHIMAEVLGEVF
jgi:hypothetical protein